MFLRLLLGLGLQLLGSLIARSQANSQPVETQDAEDPTSEAGIHVPVVFGDMTVAGVNVLGFWDKNRNELDVDV